MVFKYYNETQIKFNHRKFKNISNTLHRMPIKNPNPLKFALSIEIP